MTAVIIRESKKRLMFGATYKCNPYNRKNIGNTTNVGLTHISFKYGKTRNLGIECFNKNKSTTKVMLPNNMNIGICSLNADTHAQK